MEIFILGPLCNFNFVYNLFVSFTDRRRTNYEAEPICEWRMEMTIFDNLKPQNHKQDIKLLWQTKFHILSECRKHACASTSSYVLITINFLQFIIDWSPSRRHLKSISDTSTLFYVNSVVQPRMPSDFILSIFSQDNCPIHFTYLHIGG